MPPALTDRIDEQILLRAPKARVWRALTDPTEFGSWFGVKLDGPFIPGERVSGPITHPGYEHLRMEVWVERMDADRLFSFRWHPYAVNPDADYSAEPTTLVEFSLESAEGGTRLRVVESGFDGIPAARRDEAYRMNSGGWEQQMRNVERHLA
jgi:uncharacterized protein YndB with AHSA1/START domain